MDSRIDAGILPMNLGSFRILPASALGIDVGTSVLKVVELTRWGDRTTLKNYGEMSAVSLYDKPFRTAEKNSLLLSGHDIARALKGILQEAGIKNRKAVFSIPDFSSFFTQFTIPSMTKEEIAGAVQFEARRHVPMALSEVTFDWELVRGKPGTNEELEILLVAVPNETISQYQEIAREANLEMAGLEAEVFGLIRSSVGDDPRTIAILDIGAQSTTISIVVGGTLMNSHSVEVAGNTMTERISKSLEIPYAEAERRKLEGGMKVSADDLNVVLPLVDVVVMELKRSIQAFEQQEKKKVDRVLLGGGGANMGGMLTYFKESIKTDVEIVDPFRSVFYPPILEQRLAEIAPSYAVAVGMALRGVA